ncbi:MAG TPA: cysteine desulfurase family protein [Microbacteriaceae bacterium]|nr:cysteine desulfurase family protein [Microbacteriaceae bacterium]
MTYLDHAATSPPRAEALRAMWPSLTSEFGNPSSRHERGLNAARALDWARETCAAALGWSVGDVVFTSGGTESNNLAISGLALGSPRGRHIVSAATEHSSVRATLAWLQRWHDFEVTWVDLDSNGTLEPGALERALRDDTTLVTLMAANNEIGTEHDLAAISELSRRAGALVHTDAVQSVEWRDLRGIQLDAISLSGHKVGAPQGIGAAYIRSELPLEPTVWGGGQQRDRRSGTENLPGAIALATALALASQEREQTAARVTALRERLTAGLTRLNPGVTPTGDPERRAPHIASFVFPGISGEALLIGIEERGVQCSSGSACSAGSDEPSSVLTAIGIDSDTALSAVRFSLGRDSTADDIDAAIDATASALAGLGWTIAR